MKSVTVLLDVAAAINQVVSVKQFSERYGGAHSIAVLHAFLNIVWGLLQEPKTVKQSYRRIYFEKDLKQKLLNLALLHCIHMDRQENFDNFLELFSSTMTDCQASRRRVQ